MIGLAIKRRTIKRHYFYHRKRAILYHSLNMPLQYPACRQLRINGKNSAENDRTFGMLEIRKA